MRSRALLAVLLLLTAARVSADEREPPAKPAAGRGEAKPEPKPAPSPPPSAPVPAPAPSPGPAPQRDPPAAPQPERPGDPTATPTAEPAPPPGERPQAQPAPPPGGDFRPAPPPLWRRWFPEPVTAPASPFWWGWSWGWGFYPVYPGPDMKRPEGVEFPEPDPDRTTTTLHVNAAGMDDGGAVGLSLAVDGRRFGFEAGVDAVARDPKKGVAPIDGTQTLGLASAHLAWAFVSERNLRVRLEAGGSMVSFPDAGAYADQPYAGSVIVGPSVGISGHIGLVGPLGVEGHARLSPSPVLVEDSRYALAFRAGSLAFTYGQRRVKVYGDGKDAPKLSFGGPEVGLAFRF